MRTVIIAAIAGWLAAQSLALAEIVSVNGADIHYETKGEGEPVLFLHGFGSCGAEWEPIADEIAKQYRTIVIDMRGHGQSTNPSGTFKHRQSAEDVRALMDSLGIKEAQAIGFSSGAMTLLHLASKYPSRVTKLIVVSGTTHFPEDTRAMLRSVSFETMPPPVLEQYERCASRGETQVRELVAQFRSFGDSQDDMNLVAGDLGRITASTLIVHGDRDELFPVSIPVGMYAQVSRSALWIVPNGGHEPLAGADTSAFLNVAARFLAN